MLGGIKRYRAVIFLDVEMLDKFVESLVKDGVSSLSVSLLLCSDGLRCIVSYISRSKVFREGGFSRDVSEYVDIRGYLDEICFYRCIPESERRLILSTGDIILVNRVFHRSSSSIFIFKFSRNSGDNMRRIGFMGRRLLRSSVLNGVPFDVKASPHSKGSIEIIWRLEKSSLDTCILSSLPPPILLCGGHLPPSLDLEEMDAPVELYKAILNHILGSRFPISLKLGGESLRRAVGSLLTYLNMFSGSSAVEYALSLIDSVGSFEHHGHRYIVIHGIRNLSLLANLSPHIFDGYRLIVIESYPVKIGLSLLSRWTIISLDRKGSLEILFSIKL